MSIDNMNRFIIVLAALVSVATAATMGWRRMMGGEDAEEDEFPYMISLRYNGNRRTHRCGGSILNSQWILTAAHCVQIPESSLLIAVGSNTLNPYGRIYSLKKIIAHEGYNSSHELNDIALVQINGKIEFNDKVQSIPLNTVDIGAGEKLTMAGWGSSYFNGSLTNKLQKIVLNSLSVEDCKSKTISKKPIWEKQICTLTRAGEGTCQGDSGGPLVYNGTVAGILSRGILCAIGYPDVFTRVSSYIDWIQDNMK